MKPIKTQDQTKIAVTGCIVLGAIIYFIAPGWQTLLDGANFVQWRKQTVLLSGVIAWVLMTACMIIALRPLWLDKMTGGLDKAYGIHKWAGIISVITVILHWAIYESIKWFSSLGWITVARRLPHGERPFWMEMAKLTGEWSFYLFVVLGLLVLIKFIPYHWFSKLHKGFPIVYLLGAYHSLAMLPVEWWQNPAAYLLTILTVIGCYAAVVSLLQRIGKSRQVNATVTHIKQTASGIIEVCVQLSEGKVLPYRTGQFAFIDFGYPGEGHHPFTIASVNQNELRFVIKPLGDFTSKLEQHLHVGQSVKIEGAYGQFNFQSALPNQVWIAGGIGIAPFIGRLEELANSTENNPHIIDFWYCTRTKQENLFPDNLDELCRQAGVRLHRLVDEDDQQLSVLAIQESVPDLTLTSVWFCGPVGLANKLRKELVTVGVASHEFHAENFEFR